MYNYRYDTTRRFNTRPETDFSNFLAAPLRVGDGGLHKSCHAAVRRTIILIFRAGYD